MKLPTLKRVNTSRSMLDVFRGYNHNLRIGEGEFYEMTNLTSDDYPVLSPRRKRGVYVTDSFGDLEAFTPTSPTAMIAKDTLWYIEDGALYSTVFRVLGRGGIVNMDVDLSRHTLISMGAYIIAMPSIGTYNLPTDTDRAVYLNTEDYTDYGYLDASVELHDHLTFELCKLDGTGYGDMVVGDTAPALPEGEEEWADSTLWLDTSGDTHVLKQYSSESSKWVSVATTYIKISAPGTTAFARPLFSDNDGITISGIKEAVSKSEELNLAENAKLKAQIEALDSTMVAWKVGVDYIIVTGILNRSVRLSASDSKPFCVARKMPAMDFVIESGNRLWGCRYGVANNGKIVNEIYASKLGDPKNWNVFASISTDSYVASVGTDGQFTGAINYLGYPLFFKENCYHKVYGNFPSNYQVQTTACRGVQKGCSKSLAIVNETLFYKSRSDVCAYDGSLPTEVSSALGDKAYSDAVAGVLGNKYYISMKDEDGESHLFVYDTKKGMWHREDNTEVIEFCNCRGELYYIEPCPTDVRSGTQIKTVRGTGITDTSPVKWEAVTGIIGTDSPDKKYISRMDVRLSLNVGTKVIIYAEYDSSGVWEHIQTIDGTTLRTVAVSVRPKRCDHLRLKIAGSGDVKIFSICKNISQGSDM